MMALYPALTAAPVAVGLVTLVFFGWRRRRARLHSDQQSVSAVPTIAPAPHTHTLPAPLVLPEGADLVYTDVSARTVREALVGSFMLVGIGTFGINQVGRLLILLAQCGLSELVGSILIVENDSQVRARFHQRIPILYRDRLVYAYADAFSGGIGGREISWTLSRIDLWGVPLAQGVAEVSDLQLRRNPNRAPSDILLFTSLGGHAPLGLPIMELLHEQFEESLALAFTTLPRHERLRQHYAALKREYEQRGVFGWVLSDNLGPDPVTSDWGMIGLIVGLSDAALHVDQATQPNNAFTLALTKEPGAVLVYQVAASTVVSFAAPGSPSYYVFRQPLVEQVLKSLRRIEQGRGTWSAHLPIGEVDTSIFDLVLMSVNHEAVQRIEDAVTAGRKLRSTMLPVHNGHTSQGHVLFGQPNYETPFASLATIVNPEKPSCPVIVVRLSAVRDGANLVDEIVKAPHVRSLPGPQPQLGSGDSSHAQVPASIAAPQS